MYATYRVDVAWWRTVVFTILGEPYETHGNDYHTLAVRFVSVKEKMNLSSDHA